jgi:hypothetical protein
VADDTAQYETAQEALRAVKAVTFDLYGHLVPGSPDEVRARMDAYLEAELAAAGGPIVDQ